MVFLGKIKDLGKLAFLFQVSVFLSYLAAALSLWLTICLFEEDVSIFYPIITLFINIVEKIIGLVQFSRNQNIKILIFQILEIFYLSFLGFYSNACSCMVNCQLLKNFYFFLPMQLILAILIQKMNLSSSTQNLCITIIIILFIIMVTQLVIRLKIKYVVPIVFLNYVLILKSFIGAFLIFFCSFEIIIKYILAIVSLNLIQCFLVLQQLEKYFKIYRYEKINLYMFSIFNINHGSLDFITPGQQFQYYACSQIFLPCFIFKSLALFMLMIVTQQYSLCYLTIVLYIEMMQPHLNSIMYYKFNNWIIREFKNRMELLEYLKNQDLNQNITIYSPFKKIKVTDDYIKLKEEQEIDNQDFSLQNQLELLGILYAFYEKNKFINIQQYSIYIGEIRFVVEKCISKQALYEFFYFVKKIPEPFQQPISYLAIDIWDIVLNRILRLQKISNDQIGNVSLSNKLIYEQAKLRLTPLVLQIHAFIKHASDYQVTDPRQILYDLYSDL
ncbi:hypothetical protein ABPG74_015271 [Tetrahymena malaccensis]